MVQSDEAIEELATVESLTGSRTDVNEKDLDQKDIVPASENIIAKAIQHPDARQQLIDRYQAIQGTNQAAPGPDLLQIVEQSLELSTDEALEILNSAIDVHRDNPNFPARTMHHIQSLVQGAKVNDMDNEEWLLDVKLEAGVIHFHSPYPEVRSVCDPFDDPTAPVESVRAYVLGLLLMGGSTALNTFFSPRQPAITIGAHVLQILLAPLGIGWAKIMPRYSFKIWGGHRIDLNPGPWTYKEQMFATIIFSVGNGAGSVYYIYLVQKLPQYLNQR